MGKHSKKDEKPLIMCRNCVQRKCWLGCQWPDSCECKRTHPNKK